MMTDEQTARDVLYRVITEILPDIAPEQIDEHEHLRDLGADSVDRVEIILRVTTALGVTEPLSAFGKVPSIGALIDSLTSARRSA